MLEAKRLLNEVNEGVGCVRGVGNLKRVIKKRLKIKGEYLKSRATEYTYVPIFAFNRSPSF